MSCMTCTQTRDRLPTSPHEHADVVARLRTAYEEWWTKVTERAEERIPIEIGADGASQVLINSHDWRNVEDPVCVWNQSQIRQGLEYNGHWEIEVMQAGAYEFELRRWPQEADLGLGEGIDGPKQADSYEMTYERRYTGGRALPIATAELEVGGRRHTRTVAAHEKAATFTVDLDAGPTDLRTRFSDGNALEHRRLLRVHPACRAPRRSRQNRCVTDQAVGHRRCFSVTSTKLLFWTHSSTISAGFCR